MKDLASNKAAPQALLNHFISQHKLGPSYAETAQEWFTLLAETISKHQISAGRPIIVGINGCQGSGKSTLTAFLVSVLNEVFKQATIGFSIDDFYYSKQQRISLSKSVNPLLKTRGVPGTHDINFLEATLKSLCAGEDTHLPVFEKAIDDLAPLSKWKVITQAHQIIILEGWCVGVDSQNQQELTNPVNDFEAKEDASKEWRQYVNDVLSVDYKRVFSLIDYMVMLKAPSFQQVFKWRCEQEHKLIETLQKSQHTPSQTSSAMSDEQISNFVQFYQRLTEHALKTLPASCDSVFTLDSSRGVTSCKYQ